MDARPIDLTRLFEPTTQYHVPLFQRPYVWTLEKQWEPLWLDIRAAAERLTDLSSTNDERPHFMGAIVLEFREAKELTYKSVIDGQQRLTSLQLVIAAARAAATDVGETNLARKLETLLFFEDFLVEDPDHQFKLVPTNGDRVAFHLAARYGIADLSRVPPGDSARTMEAYAYFRQAIEEWLAETDEETPATKLDALVNALRRNLRIVVIDIDKEENAQAIFETMNARGTPLLAADLVKNSLFQDAGESRAEFLYGKYWSDFDTQTWRQEVGVGRTKRPRVDLLLANWLMLKGEEDIHWQELFLDFRKYRAASQQPAENLLADLREVAAVFDHLEHFPTGSREWLFMYRLDVLEANTIRPVAIRIFGRDGIADPTDRVRALIAIESWLVRRMLCRLTTKNYNRVAKSLLDTLGNDSFTSADVISFLSALEGESQVWPDDDMLRANLRTLPYYTAITRARLRMVLEAIEAELRGPMNLPFADWRVLTVEHVMPQEWAHHWPLPVEKPSLEARITREAAKHRLGNLTLVAQPLNSSLSNAPWVAGGGGGKREALRVHNVYMLNKPLVELAAWNEEGIGRRGEELAEVVLTIWPPPDRLATAMPMPKPAEVVPPPPAAAHSVITDHAGRRRRVWDEHQALSALSLVEPELGGLGEAVLDWAARFEDLTFIKATRAPELKPSVLVHGEPVCLFALSNEKRVYLAVVEWDRIPELRDGAARRRLVQDINEATGSSISPRSKWPWFAADLLHDQNRLSRFLKIMEDLAGRLQASPLPNAAEPEPAGVEVATDRRGPSELNQRYQHFLADVLDRFMAIDPAVTVRPVVGARSWLPIGAGRTGFSFVWSVATASRVRLELYIDVGEQIRNKQLFDALLVHKESLEAAIGHALDWDRLDHRQASRVSISRETDPGRFDQDPALAEWAAEAMATFAAAFRPVVTKLDTEGE